MNRVARPFYGEALRILEEGFWRMPPPSTTPCARWAGSAMGPLRADGPDRQRRELRRDPHRVRGLLLRPRRPSFTQQRLVEAGWLGRKSGRGYYDHAEGVERPAPPMTSSCTEQMRWRILVMLIP